MLQGVVEEDFRGPQLPMVSCSLILVVDASIGETYLKEKSLTPDEIGLLHRRYRCRLVSKWCYGSPPTQENRKSLQIF